MVFRRYLGIAIALVGLVAFFSLIMVSCSEVEARTQTSDAIPQFGWTDGVLVPIEGDNNRFPGMVEDEDGNMDIFWAQPVEGTGAGIHNVIWHCKLSPEGEVLVERHVIEDAWVNEFLKIQEVFRADDGEIIIILAETEFWTFDGPNNLFFMRVDPDGEVIVSFKSIYGRPDCLFNSIDITFDDYGFVHYVLLENINDGRYLTYVRLDGHGNEIIPPVTLMEASKVGGAQVLVHGDTIYLVHEWGSNDLRMMALDWTSLSVKGEWKIYDSGYQIRLLDIFLDPSEGGTVFVIPMLKTRTTWISAIWIDPDGEVLHAVHDIDIQVRRWNGLFNDRKMGMDRFGRVHVLFTTSNPDPVYYMSFDKSGLLQETVMLASWQSQDSEDIYDIDAVFGPNGEVRVVWDTFDHQAHNGQPYWLLCYRSTNDTTDLALALDEDLGNYQEFAFLETDKVQVVLEISNLGMIDAEEVVLYMGARREEVMVLKDLKVLEKRIVVYEWEPCVGVYEVRFRVENPSMVEFINGNNEVHFSISVFDVPEPVLTVYNPEMARGEPVHFYFKPTSLGPRVFHYLLEFGDGGSTGWTRNSYWAHEYAEIGVHQARLKYKDNLGVVTDWVTVDVEISNRRPEAIITAPVEWEIIRYGNRYTLDGSGSNDPDRDRLDHTWSLTSTIDNVTTYVYGETVETLLPSGSVIVGLTVDDGHGASSSAWVEVWVEAPPVAVLEVYKERTDKITDVELSGTGSQVSGDFIEYYFDLGDNTTVDWQADPVMVHRYSFLGTYMARLKVRDINGVESGWDEVLITVENILPTAKVSMDFTLLDCNERTTLHIYDIKDPDGWVWSIEVHLGPEVLRTRVMDEISMVLPNHGPGSYEIQVVITDNSGGVTIIDAPRMIVVNEAPWAMLMEDTYKVHVGDVVILDGGPSYDPDGRIESYEWDLGDGGRSNSKVVEHTYDAPGRYTVTLTVVDGFGSTNSRQVEVLVISEEPEVVVEARPSKDTFMGPFLIVLVLLVTISVLVFIHGWRRSVERRREAELLKEKELSDERWKRPGPARYGTGPGERALYDLHDEDLFLKFRYR